MSEPAEFPVQRDTTAYYVPTFGVGMLAFMGAGLVSMFFAMARPDALDIDEIMTIDVAIGVVAAIWWIRRWYRINHERKLVIGQEGIVYWRFADRRRVIRWDEIERVTERVQPSDEGDNNVLEIELWRGKFRILDSDFVGYAQLRKLIAERLPSKTSLLNAP